MKTNILSVQHCEALTIVQLTTEPNNSFEFISLAKAMEQKQIEVTEVSNSGTVNEIQVINNSPHFVFIMDGDILSGAKQNRVLNTSVFLSPQSKSNIPVSCVEQGRWNYASPKFSASSFVSPFGMRKTKSESVSVSMKKDNSFRADQHKVWSEVAEMSMCLGVSSASSNLSDVFDESDSAFDKFLKTFRCEPKANGVAFFINKKLKHADVFNRTDIYEEYFPKMIKGISLDVYGMKSEGQMTNAEAEFKTLDLFDQLEVIPHDKHKGAALGEEKRFKTNSLSGFELNYNSHLIHLSAHMV
jgi:hypothetical protein